MDDKLEVVLNVGPRVPLRQTDRRVRQGQLPFVVGKRGKEISVRARFNLSPMSGCSFRLKRSWIIIVGWFGVREKYCSTL